MIACLAPVLEVTGCAKPSKAPLLTQEQRRVNLESFEQVWTTVRDKHFDPELGGLDWQAIHDELRPQIEQAATMSEARSVIKEMLSRLEQSHFEIIPAELYVDAGQAEAEGSRDGVTGLDVRVIASHALVTAVVKDSPADQAGVRPGWEIVRVGDDDDVASGLRRVAAEQEGKTWKDAMLADAVLSRLRGRIGDTVAVQMLDGQDRTVELEIALGKPRGKQAYRIGQVAPHYVWIDTHRIDEDIGYIAFNLFADPAYLMPKFNDAMKAFLDGGGLIVDLRGNGGGLGAMAGWMAGWLVAEREQSLGTMVEQDGALEFIVIPRATTYVGPVAILVDGLSASTSEIFAGGLQDLGRARIFGSRTAGASQPADVVKLPNADRFKYAVAKHVSRSGHVVEGIGVSPDVEVVPTRRDLLRGRDVVLEAAVAWIRGQE